MQGKHWIYLAADCHVRYNEKTFLCANPFTYHYKKHYPQAFLCQKGSRCSFQNVSCIESQMVQSVCTLQDNSSVTVLLHFTGEKSAKWSFKSYKLYESSINCMNINACTRRSGLLKPNLLPKFLSSRQISQEYG